MRNNSIKLYDFLLSYSFKHFDLKFFNFFSSKSLTIANSSDDYAVKFQTFSEPNSKRRTQITAALELAPQLKNYESAKRRGANLRFYGIS